MTITRTGLRWALDDTLHHIYAQLQTTLILGASVGSLCCRHALGFRRCPFPPLGYTFDSMVVLEDELRPIDLSTCLSLCAMIDFGGSSRA